jgi:hypothetical protein
VVGLGWVDGDRWRDAVGRARFGVLEHPRQFYAAVCTELWLQHRERHQPEPGRGLDEAIRAKLRRFDNDGHQRWAWPARAGQSREDTGPG